MKKNYLLIILLLAYSYGNAQYCGAGGTDESFERIGRVQLEAIDNTTGQTTGYNDFTGTSTDLTLGASVTITITPVWSGAIDTEGYGVWIDYNQNEDFSDPGEQIFLRAPTTSATISETFTVPLTAITGTTRMRVMLQYNSTPTGSCDTYTYGEVEDYSVNIVAPVLPPDIDVQGNSVSIPDGEINTPSIADHTDFGNVNTGGSSFVRTFTIENTGNTTDITLPSSPVSLGAGSSGTFAITSQPSDLVLSAGETTTFQVTYTPTMVGSDTAVIVIANDDPDVAEQSYSFNVQGSGVLPFVSPGSISTNLQLWLKGDAGTSLTGTDVDTWTDQSSNGFTATSGGATDAQLITNGLNFNPILRFSGGQYLSLGNPAALDIDPLTQEMTIITMIVSTGGSTGTVISKANNVDRDYQVWLGSTNRVMHYTLGRKSGTTSERYGTISALNEPKIATGVVTNNADPFQRLTAYVNGVSDPAFQNNGVSDGTSTMDVLIGARRDADNTDSGYLFNGDIAEIIMYDRPLSVSEIQRVESYLAIKYGTTLGFNDSNWDSNTNTPTSFGYSGTSEDYLDSNGNIIWDGSVNTDYGYNVFGVARDDSSELMQTQSSSVNVSPSDVLTISVDGGSISTNLSYLIVGNNGDTETLQTTTLPARTSNMLEKIWLARESTADIGNVSLSFDMSASGLSNLDDLELYVADGTSFSNYENYAGTNVGGVLTFSGINLEDGQYFTLAEPQTITGSNALFFDGVDDYVEDKTPVTDGLTDFTISAWIKNPGQSTADEKDILGQEGSYRFYINTGLNIQGGQTGGAGGNSATNTNWNNFTIVVNSTTGFANYYFNGNLYGGSGYDPIGGNTNPFRMGTFNGVDFFEGSVDEVKIFDRALTNDQIQQMVYQEIEQNGANVRGTQIPKDIQDLTTSATVPWSSLVTYYRMSEIKGNRIQDQASTDNFAFMKNITSLEAQTAPLPYVSTANGNWEDDATWLHGTVWDNPATEDWAIVKVQNNITSNANYSTLGLFVDSGVTLTVAGTNPVVTNPSPFAITSGTGFRITNTWYTELDGIIDLQGESQLVQTENSELAVSSAGYIEKDQQGTADMYTYNYWSSPVSTINNTANNQNFTIGAVLNDGTTAASPATITWTPNADGAAGPPITISTRWMYKFVNGADEDYDAWQFVRNTGTVSPGEGYTMKGSGSGAIREEQNYVFRGKPNNGVINVSPLGDGNLYLVGNPYASTIDANKFINDNIANDATSGTLFFWEHWGGGTHTLLDYQGGYATYTLSGGTPAMSHPSVSQTGSGTKTPLQYIPVGQGFFVQGDNNAGNGTSATVEFNNSQRLFLPEYITSGMTQIEFATFMRSSQAQTMDVGMITESRAIPDEIEEEYNITEDVRQKIRLGYTNQEGFHRQLLLTFDRRATDAVDRGFEGLSIGVANDDMYWNLENEKYVIQALEKRTDETEVAIGLISELGGIGMISIDALENIDPSVEIYLKNNITNETFDLRNSGHEVTLAAGETNDKYSLVFQPEDRLSVEDQILEAGINIYNDTETKEIVIQKNTNIQLEGIEMHTILGQRILVKKDELNANTIRIPVGDKASGIYIISIYSDKGKIGKKLVLQ